jgi:hypothetical protein
MGLGTGREFEAGHVLDGHVLAGLRERELAARELEADGERGAWWPLLVRAEVHGGGAGVWGRGMHLEYLRRCVFLYSRRLRGEEAYVWIFFSRYVAKRRIS